MVQKHKSITSPTVHTVHGCIELIIIIDRLYWIYSYELYWPDINIDIICWNRNIEFKPSLMIPVRLNDCQNVLITLIKLRF